jgi:hypothetical protein
MNGWIKLHRKLSENSLWTSEPFTRGQAWVDLILLANHEYGFFFLRDHKIEVERGQVGYSQLKLAERWKWSRTKVRSFLNTLEKEQQVIQQQSHSTSIITIINYDEYQKKEQQLIQQEDNRKTTGRQLQDTNKKNKEEKEEKENNLSLALQTKKSEFYDSLKPFTSEYSKEMLRDFYDYWTETNKQGTKMRFESQNFFDPSKRLKTWERNNRNKNSSFSKNGQAEIVYTPPKIKTDWK